MTLRQIINIVTLTLAFLLLAPAGLILASWNSLPGDSLYSTKRTLETIALAVLSPSYQTQTSLSTKLISRRLQEADATIDKKSSSEGLDQLKAQLALVQGQIQQAPTPEVKQQVTQKLVTTLVQTQAQLETKKQTLVAALPTTTIIRETTKIIEVPIYITPITPSPQSQPTPQPTPTNIPKDTSPEIISNIEAVQTQITQIIKEVSSETEPDRQRRRSEDHRQDD